MCFRSHIENISCVNLLNFQALLSMFQLILSYISSSVKSLYYSFCYGVWYSFCNPITTIIESECVQWKFLKLCAFFLNIECLSHDYSSILHAYDLKSLTHRKVDSNLMFLLKIINSDIDVSLLLGNVNFLVPHCNVRWFHPFFHFYMFYTLFEK